MLGNALNAGTPRGGAHAFRLNSLQRIADTRSSNGPISLLDYLVKVIMEQCPDVVPKLKAELPMLEQGAKLQLKVKPFFNRSPFAEMFYGNHTWKLFDGVC
jgi:hypothetical protein